MRPDLLPEDEDHPLFHLDNVGFEIDGNSILSNITVDITDAGVTGIIGPSGSGKSTLLRLLNKLIPPSYGRISFRGTWFDRIPTRDLRKKVGLVQQKPFLFEGTVRENVEYGPKLWGLEYSTEGLIKLLKKVALPPKFLERDTRDLSVGEQQRVSLARTIANNPQILLLDEPTSSLDVASEKIVEETLKTLNKEGIKLVIVTHSLEQTKRMTNQVLFLKDGKLVEKTPSNTFFERNSEGKIRSLFQK